jgi:hypothetical protein
LNQQFGRFGFPVAQSPGESFDFVNTPGLPVYSGIVVDKGRNAWADVELFSYADEVEAFRQDLLAHRFTLDPAPTAPEMIERAIHRGQVAGEPDDFVADFEIVDDSTPPTPAEERALLLGKLRQAEAEALAIVIPPARERLLVIDLAEIRPIRPGVELTAAERDLIAQRDHVATRKRVVHRYFANLELELEGLAGASIDGWKFAPFAG